MQTDKTIFLLSNSFFICENSDIDKILGLSIGGDDYITKPFSPREIVFRIKAQLRRLRYDEVSKNVLERRNQKITIGPISIDTDNCQVYKDGAEVKLTAKEYKILLCLAQNANRIISKERLCEIVWSEDNIGYDNAISVHIRHLREKIEDDPSKPEIITTVIGLGYKLKKIKRIIK